MWLWDSQPDLDGQGVHEGEEPCWLSARNFEEDGDAQVHEGLREVDDGLPGEVDGPGAQSDVGLAVDQL